MRGLTLKSLVCLLVAGCLAFPTPVSAAGRTGKKGRPKVSRPDADRAYKLEDIMAAPKEYLERQVFFYCRFASTANLFKTVNTRFNATEHANFAVWPDKTVLWETAGRKNVLPTLYVSKVDDDSLETLRTLNKYELIAVTGYVLNVYARYPWILVTKIERVETPGDKLCEQVVEHMQAGYDALSKDFGGVAARHFEQAVQFGLPCEYEAKAYKQMAFAYHLDNQLGKAQDYLRLAVEADRADPLLHLALADVSLRMGDADESIAHCVFAMERSGRYPQTYGIMGEAASLKGDFVKAFNDLNAAANTPGITPREKSMINVRRARIYVRAKRYADAAQVYAAVSEPGEPLGGEAWLHNEVGLFYESLYLISKDARYLDSAYEAYGEAAKLGRNTDAAVLYNQAEAEYRRQKLSASPTYGAVRELLGVINQVEPEYSPARILEGRVLFAEGKAEEADMRYQSVAKLIGNDAMALMSLAEAYLELGDYAEAAATVQRARRLQPWNIRIQALGGFLENAAEPMLARESQYASAEEPAAAHEPVETFETYEPYVDPAAQPEIIQPTWDGQDQPRAAEPQPYTTKYEQWTPRDAGGAAAIPATNTRYDRPAGQASADIRPDAAYRVDGRLITVRPGESIRVSSDGTARSELRPGHRPQEIQASAVPAALSGRPERPYPVTQVRLDNATSAYGDAASIYRNAPIPVQPVQPVQPSPAYEGNPAGGPAVHSLRPNQPAPPAPTPLNLGYTPVAPDAPFEPYEEPAAQPENLDFGMVPGSSGAMASVPQWGVPAQPAGVIPPFTFEPDESPVIIAGFRAPGESAHDLPVRNANLYRRAGGGRQPAEIIEKEPVSPKPVPDMSVMAPPGDGAVHRAEVRLPSSSMGIGMVSDFQPGR